MVNSLLIFFSLSLGLWEQLLEQPSCLNAEVEKHMINTECSTHVCHWPKQDVTLVFLVCDVKQTMCTAIEDSKIVECSKFENQIKY